MTGFGGAAGTGGAGIFDSTDDTAIVGADGVVFSSGFATGAFTSEGIEARSGTSTRVGVAGTRGGSVHGFSVGGAAGFAGGQLATPPSCAVPHQGQKVISFF